jgi:hypothetical protein
MYLPRNAVMLSGIHGITFKFPVLFFISAPFTFGDLLTANLTATAIENVVENKESKV